MKRPLVLGTIVATGLVAITVFGQQAAPPAAAPAFRFPPLTSIEKTAEQAMAELKLPNKFSGYTLSSTRGGPGGNFNVMYTVLRK